VTVHSTTTICPSGVAGLKSSSIRRVPSSAPTGPAGSAGTGSTGSAGTPSATPAFNAAGRATLSGVAVVIGALCAAAMQI
jgi:hypothetical protein